MFREGHWESLDRKNRLHERLKQLTPAFLEIRKKMGIGENIGFGSLPKVHSEQHTLGALPDIIKTKEGRIKYSCSGFLGQIYQEKLSRKEAQDIFVMPNPSGQKEQRIVSVCDPYAEWNAEMANLTDAPDAVFVGVIAHELAHCFNPRSKFPPEIICVLKNRFRKENPNIKSNWSYGGSDEQEIDIIAASFGYKEQIIAKIDFLISRLNKFGPYFKEKERIIKSLELRRQQVLKYCP